LCQPTSGLEIELPVETYKIQMSRTMRRINRSTPLPMYIPASFQSCADGCRGVQAGCTRRCRF
jgi:hypothetical protein